jgi:hypothetical protein
VDPGKQVSFVDIFLVETLLSSKIHRLAKLLFGPPIACASSRWPEAASKHTAGDADAAADCSNPAITRASFCAHAGHAMAAKLSTAMHLVILPFLNGRRCAGGATKFAKCAIYRRFRRMPIRDSSRIKKWMRRSIA